MSDHFVSLGTSQKLFDAFAFLSGEIPAPPDTDTRAHRFHCLQLIREAWDQADKRRLELGLPVGPNPLGSPNVGHRGMIEDGRAQNVIQTRAESEKLPTEQVLEQALGSPR